MGVVRDLTGKIFGEFTVISRAPNNKFGKAEWLCKCNCGVEKVVTGSHLFNGETKSCGCLQKQVVSECSVKDLKDMQFGLLTVLKRSGSNKHGKAMWLCKCACGNEIVVLGASLLNKETKSCGCFKAQQTSQRFSKPFGVVPVNSLYKQYLNSANRRGYAFSLTKEDIKNIVLKECFYCGKKPSQLQRRFKTRKGAFFYNGIDRVNNTEGYTLDNVVPCCKQCNRAKDTSTVIEFENWIKSVYTYRGLQEDKIDG